MRGVAESGGLSGFRSVNASCRMTLIRDLWTRMRPLYSMRPSLRKRFMKKLTRERVVPIISARASWGIRERTLHVHHADHLFARNLQRSAGNHGRGGDQVPSAHAGQRLFSNKFPGIEKRNRALLAFGPNDGEFCAAGAKIKDGNSRISL